MPSQTEYNKRYYRKNKGKILARRKLRYVKDKEYRDGILRRSKTRAILNKARKTVTIPSVIHNKVEERSFSLSELCEITNRHKSVLYRLRWNGVVPRPIHFDAHRRGIYSASQVYTMRDLFRMVDEGDPVITYRELGMVLNKLWRRTYDDGEVILQLARAKERAERNGNSKKESGTKEDRRASRNRVRRARRRG